MARTTTRRLGAIAWSFLSDVEERQKRGGIDVLGLPTGLDYVDDLTGGLQPDNMWVIGARTSVGKTALALGISLAAAAASGDWVFFYSLEMRGEALVNRLVSGMTGIPSGRIKRGKLDQAEFERVRQAVASLDQLRVVVIDESMTSEALRDHALRSYDSLLAKHPDDKIGLIVVDNAHIMADRSALGSYQKMTEISNRIRNLARPNELDCPVLLLAQLNRQSEIREDHRPQLSDLKESGSLEQDAEVVIFPFRPYLYERLKGAELKEVENDAEIIVAKNREGPVMTTRAKYYPKTMTWEQKRAEPVDPKPVSLVEQVKRGRK